MEQRYLLPKGSITSFWLFSRKDALIGTSGPTATGTGTLRSDAYMDRAPSRAITALVTASAAKCLLPVHLLSEYATLVGTKIYRP